ncbi:MAG: ABC transporter permease [Myxococcaceae bacterium]
MHALWPIALNTFREARRNRVFYSILLFAVLLILFSVLFTEVTFVAQDRILRDVGFATINLFGVGMAIFLGIGMVNREIERKTIYTVISKPVPRWAFVVGKDLGLLLTVGATVGLMFGGFLLTLLSYRSPIEWVLLQPLYTLFLELAVLTAFAVFCSTWTSSALSAFLTAGLFVIGHFAQDIRDFGARSQTEMIRLGSSLLYHALPDLERFNLKHAVAYLKPVPLTDLGLLTVYATLWSAVFLLAAIWVFRQRDLR